MRNRKLSILACCVAVGIGSSTQAQPATDTPDDQAKVLEALHQAEHSQPEPPAKAKKKAKKEKKKAEEAAAPVAPVAPPVAATPPPATGAPASTPDDDARLLEALHQAEHVQPAPVVVSTPVVVTPVPEPVPAPVVAAPAPAVVPVAVAGTPGSNSDDDARAIEALHQAQQQQPVPSTEVTHKDTIEAEKKEARKQQEAIKAQKEAERLAAMRAARIEAEAKAHREAAERLLQQQQYQKDKAKVQANATLNVPGVVSGAAPSSPEDDARVLAALREAEHGAPVAVVATPAPVTVISVPPGIVPLPAPVAVAAVPATSPEDNSRELEALRKAELGQTSPAPVAVVAVAPPPAVAAPAPVAVAAVPASSGDDNARALEALHQAEHVQPAPVASVAPAVVAPSGSPEDSSKMKKSAAEAAKRKKAQEEVAKRLEKLQKDLNSSSSATASVTVSASAPAPVKPIASTTPTAVVTPAPTRVSSGRPVITADKEQRLAELLRLYKSDQITPLQYHTERAKILAEP